MKRTREEENQSVHFDQLFPIEIIDYIRFLIHKVIIQEEETLSPSNGIKKQVNIQLWKNCYDSGFHPIIVYLHPRELYIKWANRFNEIPFDDLLNIKKVIIYLINDFTCTAEYDQEWAIQKMGNESYENLVIFMNAWNINKFKEIKEKTEKEIVFLSNRFKIFIK